MDTETKNAKKREWYHNNQEYRAKHIEYCKRRYHTRKANGINTELEYYYNNRTAILEKSRLKGTGCTPEQYEQMLADQDGKCFICDSPPGKKQLHVDHCHKTGQIRRLLCHKCNRALGLLKDDPKLMRKAVFYLESFDGTG